MTKYCTSSRYGTVDNKTVLEAADDAATANWGGSWCMPTVDEIKELFIHCTCTWTSKNDVNGYYVVGPNGNSIFLPAAGNRHGSMLEGVGTDGFCLSSSLSESHPDSACCLGFDSTEHYLIYYIRYFGLPVRPVCQ